MNEETTNLINQFYQSNAVQGLSQIETSFPKIIDFVFESTKHFDSSHNIDHALKVAINACQLIDEDEWLDKFDVLGRMKCEKIILELALLHDVCDHKYPESILKDQLESFIRSINCIHDTNMYMKIIDNVSWSKENKGLTEQFPDYWQHILHIVMDADRLEAIGQIGIKRCIAFTNARNGDFPNDVIQHCEEKLLRIYPEKFIRTKKGRKLALPLHEEMLEMYENMKEIV